MAIKQGEALLRVLDVCTRWYRTETGKFAHAAPFGKDEGSLCRIEGAALTLTAPQPRTARRQAQPGRTWYCQRCCGALVRAVEEAGT